jgi:hypothetical protein
MVRAHMSARWFCRQNSQEAEPWVERCPYPFFRGRDKSEAFGFVRDLIVRLKTIGMGMLFELSAVIMAQSSRTLVLMPFA